MIKAFVCEKHKSLPTLIGYEITKTMILHLTVKQISYSLYYNSVRAVCGVYT